MKKLLKKIAVFMVFATSLTVFVSCSDKEENSKNKLFPLDYREKMDNGFLIRNVDSNGRIEIYSGVSLTDFIRTTIITDTTLIYDGDILYDYEYMGEISVSNKKGNSFIFHAFKSDFLVSDLKNEGYDGISFTIRDTSNTVMRNCVVRYNSSMNVKTLLDFLYNTDYIPNPFRHQFTKFAISIGTAIAIAGLVIAASAVVTDVVLNKCDASRDRDKSNCEKTSKRCIKDKGFCHYECIPCKK